MQSLGGHRMASGRLAEPSLSLAYSRESKRCSRTPTSTGTRNPFDGETADRKSKRLLNPLNEIYTSCWWEVGRRVSGATRVCVGVILEICTVAALKGSPWLITTNVGV